MPGNDFEKQVQQRMDELQFAPSDAVWPEVERQIAESKKRRTIFLWLPLLMLVLGGAMWLYHTRIEKNTAKAVMAVNKTDGDSANNHQLTDTVNTTAVITTATTPNAHQPKTEPSADRANAAGPQAPGKMISVPAHDQLQQHAVAAIKDRQQKINEQEPRNAPGNPINDDKRYSKNVATGITRLQQGTDNDNREAVLLAKAGKKNTGKLKVTKATREDAAIIESMSSPVSKLQQENSEAPAAVPQKITSALPVADSLAINGKAAIVKTDQRESAKTNDKTDTAKAIAENKAPVKTKKNIEWGITMNAGRSSVSSGLATLFPSQNLFASPSVSLSNGAAGGNSSGAGLPSAIRPGFSFTAGVFVQKRLGRNFKMLTGLHYHYYSNHITVGTRTDSSTGALQYQADSRRGTATYTNQFHFIELPVVIEKQLGKTSRFSINTGLSLAVLAGTNALVYDAQKANYTTDKSYINKLQLGLLAGFNYQLFPAKHPVEIGPQINYSLSSIFKKDLYGSRHLFFYGINARVLLHKK